MRALEIHELHDAVTVIDRLQAAADPWAELSNWMQECSAGNTDLGGDEEAFVALVVVWLTQLSLPIRLGGQK
ncbi:MAG: hypothetical protein IE922_09630 [Sphingomonadales bacterium]|nr:hypothetical protein [Sphingomonadales bacterium]